MIREMGGFKVTQRTSDAMFNATVLMNQWNSFSGMKKEVKDFLKLKGTSEFIEELIKDDEFFKQGESPYLKNRGKYGGTWMHPLLFIDFAMWLNPRFKVKVLKFVYDNLIKFRHDAGDDYKSLFTDAVATLDPPPKSYGKIGMLLNEMVFGYHIKDMRNTASEDQLAKLVEVQKYLATLINNGFISSYSQFIDYMTDRIKQNKLLKSKIPSFL